MFLKVSFRAKGNLRSFVWDYELKERESKKTETVLQAEGDKEPFLEVYTEDLRL